MGQGALIPNLQDFVPILCPSWSGHGTATYSHVPPILEVGQSQTPISSQIVWGVPGCSWMSGMSPYTFPYDLCSQQVLSKLVLYHSRVADVWQYIGPKSGQVQDDPKCIPRSHDYTENSPISIFLDAYLWNC